MATEPEPTPTPRERTDRSDPLGLRLLLAVASAAVAYAILLGLGLIPASPLPAAGAFALVGLTLFFLAWSDPEWGPASSAASVPARAPPAAAGRHDRAIPIPHRSIASPRPSPPIDRPVSPGVPIPIVRAIPVGDMLWTRLNPDPVGGLPVELVGPIAESALESLPGESYEAAADLAGWAGEVATVAGAPAWPVPEIPAGGTWTPTEHEAFNHLPPHLRASPPSWKEVRGPHPPTSRSSPPDGPHCASCQRALSNPPAWRSCTSCHRPFCGDCAFRARRNLGTGRCTTCRARTEIEEPRFVA
jgi:hypothetical protein